MVGRYKRRLASPILAEEKREAAALQRNLQVCDAHSRQLWPVLWEVNYKGPCHCLKYEEENFQMYWALGRSTHRGKRTFCYDIAG